MADLFRRERLPSILMGIDLCLRLGCLQRDVAVELNEMYLRIGISHHLIGIDLRHTVDMHVHIRLSTTQPHVAHIDILEHNIVDRHHIRSAMFLGRNSHHPVAIFIGNGLILLFKECNSHRLTRIGCSPDACSVVALNHHSARNDLWQFYLSLDRISRYSQHSCKNQKRCKKFFHATNV